MTYRAVAVALSFSALFFCAHHTASAQGISYADCFSKEANGKSKLANKLSDASYAASFKEAYDETVKANDASVRALRKLDASIADVSGRMVRLKAKGASAESQAAEKELSDLQKRRREVVDYQANVLKPGWKRLTNCDSDISPLAAVDSSFMRLSHEQRYWWIHGAVTTTAHLVAMRNKQKGDCAAQWFLRDREAKQKLVEDSIALNPSELPTTVVLGLLTRACGELLPS